MVHRRLRGAIPGKPHMSSIRRFERFVAVIILLWLAVLAAAVLLGCAPRVHIDGAPAQADVRAG